MPLQKDKIDAQKKFVRRLLKWFKTNRRRFSWRTTADPYSVLVAEMMLQKTTSRKVDDVFPRFIKRYPSLDSLAKAPVGEIEERLKPLGLHRRRSRDLKRSASKIMAECGEKVPNEKRNLLALPGVGDYIANAVLCFAFGKDVPLVDVNVARIMKRVFHVKVFADPRRDERLWKIMESMVPQGHGREFNWALVDFGALVCTARGPECSKCPLKEMCLTYSSKPTLYPTYR